MTNFVGGALAGIITSLFQLVNNAPGTASPIPGLLVLFGFNDVVKVTIRYIMWNRYHYCRIHWIYCVP